VKLVDKDDGEDDLPTEEGEASEVEAPDDDTIH
jgi:hypothetical protein